MKIGSFTRILVFIIVSVSLSGCFKKWEYEEVQSWYEKKPESFDEYMQFAREKVGEGKTERAMELYGEGMRLVEGMYGPEDPRIATAAEELGVLQEKAGMLNDAETSFKKALEVRSKTLSPKSADLVRTRKKLAEVLMKNYKSDDAKAVLDGGLPGQTKTKTTPPGEKKRTRRHNL